MVVTENGTKPIEEISVGDKVLAYDESTGERATTLVASETFGGQAKKQVGLPFLLVKK